MSTWGHARSVAVQSFRADAIYADEAARSSILFPLAVLMQRSLNTTMETTTMPKDDKGRVDFNPYPVNRLVLIGDPRYVYEVKRKPTESWSVSVRLYRGLSERPL